MARDEARADRIRELYNARKAEDPSFTWQKLADHVGVSVRAAQAWPRTGGIDPKHLTKIAEALQADPDYIWRGRREDTPDLLGALDGEPDQLQEINDKLDRLLAFFGLEQAIAEEPTIQDQIVGMFRDAAAQSQRPAQPRRS